MVIVTKTVMASIAEKIKRLQLLKQQTNILRHEVSSAKSKLATTTTEYCPDTFNAVNPSNNSHNVSTIRDQLIAPIIEKQKQAQIILNKQHASDALISSIMATMPKIDYEAEAARLILRDGKQSLATAIANENNRGMRTNYDNNILLNIGSQSSRASSSTNTGIDTNKLRKITIHDSVENNDSNNKTYENITNTDNRIKSVYIGDDSEFSDMDLSDDDSLDNISNIDNLNNIGNINKYDSDSDEYNGYDSDEIEIDDSRYPHLDPIRTRPPTPDLDNAIDNLTDSDIKCYVNQEYDKNIKTIKCWCIMANNSGYSLFDSLEINTIKQSLSTYQLIPITTRADANNIDWLDMFIQWFYVELDASAGGKCYFGRGWVLKYYPNHYHGKYPRLVVSTKYRPDFNNDRQISAIFKSGYTISITLDGKTPIFRQIIAEDVATFICNKNAY